jgi:hypothetical protein
MSGPFARRASLLGLVAVLAIGLVVAGCKIGSSGGKSPGRTPAPTGEPGGAASGSACFTPPSLSSGEPAAAGAEADWTPLTLPAGGDDCFRMTAEASDALGVDPAEGFVLETKDALSPEELEALLAIDPPIAFEVAAVGRAPLSCRASASPTPRRPRRRCRTATASCPRSPSRPARSTGSRC